MTKKNQNKKTDKDKNLVKKVNSLTNDKKSKKSSYDLHFDEKRLSSTDTLDTSFLEGRMRANFLKKAKVKEERKKKENVEISKQRVYRKSFDFSKFLGYFIIILAIIIGGVFGFYLCHKFYPTIQVQEKLVIKEKEVVDNNYLFLGDSITYFYDLDKYYENLPVVNSGICGNTTDDILNDMKKRVYQYNPSKIFILIGTNDYQFSRGNESIKENLPKIIEEIQSNRPLAKIYIESIYPVNRTNNSKIDLKVVGVRNNEDIQIGNEFIKQFAKEKNLTYIDLYSILYDEEDEGLKLEYTQEGLHISDEGYEVITNEIIKYLD